MRKNYEGNYYIGLDLGTESIGWAVTDQNYKLLRANGKNLWGVRLFEKASTAVDRRVFRESRRRLERRKLRINLLQQIFAPTINQIDSNFFARLDDSNLYGGDKREDTLFSLFSDKNFNDMDFHKKYKTVYHLRLALMSEKDPDPRLVYLALHHIIKYRGHFLIEGDVNAIDSIDEPLENINAYLFERDLDTLKPVDKDGDFRVLLAQKDKKTKRAEKYKEFYGATKGSAIWYILDLIAGKTVAVKDLPVDCDENEKICFEGDWESVEGDVRALLQDDYWLVENAKLIYDYAQYKTLLAGCNSLSQAMVQKYEKHKDDLKALKYVMKTYFSKKDYDLMFRDMPNKNQTNYTAYSGKLKFGARGDRNNNILKVESTSRTVDDFYKYVKSVIKSSPSAEQDEVAKQILADIENGEFMPKQVSKSNALLPHQLNLIDLRAILDNVSKYDRYAFLNDVDEDGISIRNKIESLLTFHMPYYVGPTNAHSENCWMVRKADGKILPWNVDKKVDLVATERNFIQRMTNKCPYVKDAKVLPKCSLAYEEFLFLDRVNKIEVNGNLIDPKTKDELSRYIAITGKKLSPKTIKDFLLLHNQTEKSDEVSVKGLDDKMKLDRRMYYQFAQILGGVEQVEQHRQDIEDMILYATIAGSEKSNLVKKLREYDFLTEEQIKRIKGLACNGWGRFSIDFLQARVGITPETGELDSYSIMDALRDTNENLMEIYSSYDDRFGFRRAFESMNQSDNENFGYDAVDELYCSPAVKKQIWQAVCVAKEIVKVAGGYPKKVFVEVAREDDEKGLEKQSRYKALQQAYERLKAENVTLYSEAHDKFVYDKLIDCEKQPQILNNQKLFLYFMQNGIDIYTGEPIDYDHLELYDKDHIYPRSKLKDDSLMNNLVLTLRTQNGAKTDKYPIDYAIQNKMTPFWRALNKNYGGEKNKNNSFKLMTDEKFARLTRKTELTDEELADFVNRQLVETRQTTKETISFLHRMFPNTEIVWSKAGNVSEFRDKMTKVVDGKNVPMFVKSREINDMHHAKDAYLNIVVGNTYNVCYGHSALFWQKEHAGKKLPSLSTLFEHDVKTKNCVAWIAGKDGTIEQVEKTMRSNAVLFTNESKVNKGALFNATIYKKGDNLVPLKGETSDNRKFALMANTQKYGGYDSEKRVYFMLVKFTERKMKKGIKDTVKYKLLGVTARYANCLNTNESRIEYCEKNGLLNPVVLIPKIKIKTMFEFDGTLLMLSGVSNKGATIVWQLAQQNSADEETTRYFKKVCKVVDAQAKLNKFNKDQIYPVDFEHDGIDEQKNMELYNLFVQTLKSDRYKGASSLSSLANKIDTDDMKEKFQRLPLARQCRVLLEIQKSLQCNAVASDLSLLGEGKTCGKILTSSVFDTLEGRKICHRSITGIFEQKIPLEQFDKE